MHVQRQSHKILTTFRLHLNTLTTKLQNKLLICLPPKQELLQISQEKLFLLFIGPQNKRNKPTQRKTPTIAAINNKQTSKNNKLRIFFFFRTLKQSKKVDLLRHQFLNLILFAIYKALEYCMFSQILKKNKMHLLILCSLLRQTHRLISELFVNINTAYMK